MGRVYACDFERSDNRMRSIVEEGSVFILDEVGVPVLSLNDVLVEQDDFRCVWYR